MRNESRKLATEGTEITEKKKSRIRKTKNGGSEMRTGPMARYSFSLCLISLSLCPLCSLWPILFHPSSLARLGALRALVVNSILPYEEHLAQRESSGRDCHRSAAALRALRLSRAFET